MKIPQRLLPAVLLAVFQLTVAASGATQENDVAAGTLVGQVTSSTAALWMHAAQGADVVAHYRADADGAQEQAAKFVPIEKPVATGVPGRPAKVTLRGLKPATAYRFRVSIDGKFAPEWSCSFKTAPVEGRSCRFRLGLTSCMKYGQPQDSWKLFLKEKPDLHLTVGDTQYSDSTDADVQWRHHLRYRRVPEFAEVIRNVPTIAVWDDHDYGPNNSDGAARGKEASLASWRQVWANPRLGTNQTPGAFFKYSWGDVDFFVLDGRYHRSPDRAPDNDKKRMLGDEQFTWLLDGLKKSSASFKIIASGSTLDHSRADGWKIYTFSRHRLFDAIRKHNISGVVYLSGDIHRSLVWEHRESGRVGYPLVEVVSSGIANSKTLSFATIDFDTTLADPTMRVRIVQGNGAVSQDKTWKLSQLQGRAR